MSNHENTYELPTPFELLNAIPQSLEEKEFVLKCRKDISSILNKNDERKLLIVGPCSVHDTEAVLDYAERLKKLQDAVRSAFYIVMRVYVEKPRTTLGWKGFLHDPFIDGSHDISAGFSASRKLFKEITALKMPIATEFLDPATPFYLSDYVSWGCIGARTSSSQVHRQIASYFSLPMAFKNTVEGNVEIALHAIEAAGHPHTFIGPSLDGKLRLLASNGNPNSHLVLRGSEKEPNYSSDHVANALLRMKEKNIEAGLLIDCSHGNSRKNHLNQIPVFENVIDQIAYGQDIQGLMLESFLEPGTQVYSENAVYGKSITDACLSWDQTEDLILKGFNTLSHQMEKCDALV